jgi:hypothetical protein
MKEMGMADRQTAIVMEEVTDSEQLAKARAQQERFDRNAAWLQAHAAEVYPRYRGKCLCVAGEELFVADTPEEALAMATAVHPEDDGRFLRYVPREKVARISSVLGRDITGLFAVIVDRPGDLVCLVGQRHRYSIITG